MVKNNIKKFIFLLRKKKIIYFLNIKNIKSKFILKIRKKFYKKNIIMKTIKNSIYKKYINNKKLLNNKIIKNNLTILIYKKSIYDIENNFSYPINIIYKFKKKYKIFNKLIKAIYLKNKIYYKKKDFILINNLKNKKKLFNKLNYILIFNIYNLLYNIKHYIYNIITLLLFLKNVKKT
ncbi:MAG: hypothetical protein ABNO60_00455 [Candidatus Shikimatogenerans sp. Tcar]|uniref:50S ribosomal protein L10 n=1 Tax=Candidatus Shikimatogenerans sp. Tcar TaxID=3158565 RepID=A0AAU7QS19_9FLAO